MENFKKYAAILVGQFINSVAFTCIMLPNKLVPSGLGGIATIFNNLFGLDLQFMLIALALPIILWAFIKYERKKVYYAAFCYGVFTFYVGVVEAYIPPFITDPIIAAVLSAVILGVGGGIVIGRNVPNGPEAIVGLYLKEYKDMNVANFLMVFNMIVIGSSIIYGDLTMIVYSLICNYIIGIVTNYVIVGSRKYYVVNIVSDHYLDITEFIHNELDRTVTFVQSMDASSVRKKMLLKTVMSNRELVRLRDYVRKFHDDSFVYAIESTSIIGGGFESR